MGWSSEVGSAKCIACGAGTFGIGCQICPMGFARQREDDDATQCRQCKLGETTAIKGAAKCDTCDAGTFGNTQGVCSECPSGFYQNTKGKTRCVKCQVGESFDNVQTSCRKCETGRFGNQTFHCTDCPTGQYQDGKGETECNECDVDTYLNEKGKASKADCAACSKDKSTGTSTGNIDQSACLCKRTEYYQHDTFECRDCPSGADCSTRDGTSLSELFAKPGYYRPSMTSTQFVPCKQGYTGPDAKDKAKERCCPLNNNNESICSTMNASNNMDLNLQCAPG